MSKKDPIEDYEVVIEDLLKIVAEKSKELGKIIQETEDYTKKSILSEASKRIKILQDFLESEMRKIKIYYEAGTVHTGEALP